MCGRYAMQFRPGQLRQQMRQTNMRVDRMITRGPNNQQPRLSYNVAPTYVEQVYRAVDTSVQTDRYQTGLDDYDIGGEVDSEGEVVDDGREYILQSMKWGLIPHWSKQPSNYSCLLRTINCRSDTIAQQNSMWTSMSNTKRCIVPMEGFYEWLPKGKDRIPYYIRHPTSPLLYLAGLYDSVVYEGETEPVFTYTIITTDSNKQLSFLHDRMPVILELGSQEMLDWLDPTVKMWNPKLQGILKSYEGELKVDQVGMEVNKVGSDGVGLTVPVEEKKGNIKNFFSAKKVKEEVKREEEKSPTETRDEIDKNAILKADKDTKEEDPIKNKDKEANITLEEGAKQPYSEPEEHKSEKPQGKSETELSLAVDDNLDVPNEGRKRKGSPSEMRSEESETSESAPKKQQKLEDAFEFQATSTTNPVKKTPTKSPAKKGGKVAQGPAGVPKITSFFKK